MRQRTARLLRMLTGCWTSQWLCGGGVSPWFCARLAAPVGSACLKATLFAVGAWKSEAKCQLKCARANGLAAGLCPRVFDS